MLNKEIYALHFHEQLREYYQILNLKKCVIKKSGNQFSHCYQKK